MSLESFVGLLVLKGLWDFLLVGWLIVACLSFTAFAGLSWQLEEAEEFAQGSAPGSLQLSSSGWNSKSKDSSSVWEEPPAPSEPSVVHSSTAEAPRWSWWVESPREGLDDTSAQPWGSGTTVLSRSSEGQEPRDSWDPRLLQLSTSSIIESNSEILSR